MLVHGAAAALRRYAEQRLGDVLNLELSSRILDHAATSTSPSSRTPSRRTCCRARPTIRAARSCVLRRGVERGGLGGPLHRAGRRPAVGGLAGRAGAGAGSGAVRRPSLAPRPRALRARAHAHAAATWAPTTSATSRGATWCRRRRILGLAPLLGARFRERLAGIHDESPTSTRGRPPGRILGYAVYLIGPGRRGGWVAARTAPAPSTRRPRHLRVRECGCARR